MAKEKLFHITPATGEKIKAVVNWIDKEAKIHRECGHTVREKHGPWCETCECLVDERDIATGIFGISFVDKYPYQDGGDVLRFEDKGKTWSFK